MINWRSSFMNENNLHVELEQKQKIEGDLLIFLFNLNLKPDLIEINSKSRQTCLPFIEKTTSRANIQLPWKMTFPPFLFFRNLFRVSVLFLVISSPTRRPSRKVPSCCVPFFFQYLQTRIYHSAGPPSLYLNHLVSFFFQIPTS